MRICDVVINSVWFDPRVRKQIAEYTRCGHDVHIVGYQCNRYDAQKIAQMPAPAEIVHLGTYHGKLHSPIKKLYREHLRNKAIENAIVSTKPDVIHANDYAALVPAYRAAKRLKCRLVYDSHEICAANDYSHRHSSLISKLIYRNERKMCRKLDQMVCVSHAAAEYFAKEYKIETPMVVTNCALAAEIPEAGTKHECFEILNHGQFYEGRGYDLMVEAAPLLRELPQVRLAMRGFGRIEEALHKRVQELDAKNVVFYPKVLVQELIPEATKSHVGVAITEPICLNFKLSVSNKLFEYAAAGLPVIMSDIPEHRYLNERYNFGLILEKNTPECFAAAVRALYENHELYETLANNARRLSHEVNWETAFGRLIEKEKELVYGKK